MEELFNDFIQKSKRNGQSFIRRTSIPTCKKGHRPYPVYYPSSHDHMTSLVKVPLIQFGNVLKSFVYDFVTDLFGQAEDDFLSNFKGTNFFSVGIFMSVFVLPSILLAFIYGRIYMEAHKNLVRIRFVFPPGAL